MMKKTRIKTHLRWLVPVFIYFIVLAIVLVIFKNDIRKKAVVTKETEIAHAIHDEIADIDLSIKGAMSYVEASSKAMSFYALEYNNNQIIVLLKNIMDNTDATEVYVCDSDGVGYDNEGKEISLSEYGFFEEIVAEYSRGGSGMVRPDDADGERAKEVLLVSQVTFEKKEHGYLIARLPIEDLSDRIFMDKYLVEAVAIVTMDGYVISMTGERAYDEAMEQDFWEMLPEGLSRNTIKLSISQKNEYMSEIPGYGYVVLLPMKTTNGGVVALIRYDQMKAMTKDVSEAFISLTVKIISLSILLVIMVFVSYYLSDVIEARIIQKKLSAIEIDPATGLLTRTSAEQQIKAHIEDPSGNGGLLFLIGIEGIKKETELDIKIADARRHAFAKALGANFRASDIVARVGDDRYIVFLKNVSADKDVRKQTDEMQMFLHDVEINDEKEKISAHAGAALYPENGKTVQELINSAQEAYERSKMAGVGRLSF